MGGVGNTSRRYNLTASASWRNLTDHTNPRRRIPVRGRLRGSVLKNLIGLNCGH